MKKTLLLLSALAVGFSSFAQNEFFRSIQCVNLNQTITPSNPLAKTTGTTDTIGGAISYNSVGYHEYAYGTSTKDSGLITGMNVWGDKAYAQRYDFNGADSGVQVQGAVIFFAGKHVNTSTKTVTIKCWGVGAQTVINSSFPHEKYSGLPSGVLATTSAMSINSLGIYAAGNGDTIKQYNFPTPASSASIGSSFFVGAECSSYTGTALAGDTVGIITDSLRTLPTVVVSGADTLLNDVTAVELSTGAWDDLLLTANSRGKSGGVDFYIIPVLIVKHYNIGFQGVTRNNLTWYGNYPNPANGNTTFKFSLNNSADITIQIIDMSGRSVDVIKQTNVVAGTHEIAYNTSKLAAGNYTYIIRTNTGDGMASILSVVK